jgi:hypothetical protein
MAPAWGATSVFEDWNSTAFRNHTWSYYHAAPGGSGDVDAVWNEHGGIGNTGHISTPLDALTWVQGGYYPFYLYHPNRMQPEQRLSLTQDSLVAASFWSEPGFDWGGAQLYFFVGMYDDVTQNQSFYYRQIALSASTGGYADNLFSVGVPWVWTRYYHEYYGGTDLTLESILPDVQQYGFVLVGGGNAPVGTLHLDDFHIVPAPELEASGWVASLACLGLSLSRRNRR